MTNHNCMFAAKVKSMKIKLSILILTMGLLALTAASSLTKAQSSVPLLPSDLLFVPTITGGEVYFSRNTIMRVDAKTLEVSTFYVDEEAWELMPISWSSQRDLLVIYRIMPTSEAYSYSSSPRQLCILDQSGVMQLCFDDGPPMHYAGRPDEWSSFYPVAWGPDGKTIYFETEYPNENSLGGYGRRIVEASVITGETLRVVYDYPDPYPVAISSDLNHIAVGFKEQWLGSGSPTFLYDLTTGVQLDASDLVPDNTGIYWTCWGFSPGGQFATTIAQYNVTRYAPELPPPDDFREGEGTLILLLDMQGTIQHIVGEPEGSPTATFYLQCPGWQPDEQAIVFYAWDANGTYIMRYSLADRQTTKLYTSSFEPGHERYFSEPFMPSPDGAHVALTVSDGPYEDRQVAVLYPDGEIYRIPSPYRFGLYPLWVPPCSAVVYSPTYSDSFETAGDDTCWTTENWQRLEANGNHFYEASPGQPDIVKELTLLASVNLTGVSQPVLTYHTAYDLEYATAMVEISTDGGNQWTTLQTITDANTLVDVEGVPTLQWVDQQINLSAYADQYIQLRFHYDWVDFSEPPNPPTASARIWRVDDVVVAPSNQLLVDIFYTPDNWQANGTWTWTHNSDPMADTCYADFRATRTVIDPYVDTLTLNTPLDLTGASLPTLRYSTWYNLTDNEIAQVQVSTDDGQTWTTVQEITGSTLIGYGFQTLYEQQVDLSPYSNQTIWLRFQFEALPASGFTRLGQSWTVDNIQVSADGSVLPLPPEPPCWE